MNGVVERSVSARRIRGKPHGRRLASGCFFLWASEAGSENVPPTSMSDNVSGEKIVEKTVEKVVEGIVLDDLGKRFGDFVAADGISLTVSPGTAVGFLGPNGAGKSTTMRMIAGILTPDSGRATVCGFDSASDSKRAKQALGYLPEGAPSYAEMTPRSFLRFVASARGLVSRGGSSPADRALERAGLEDVADQTIDTLSKGYKRRVGLAQAIVHDPPALVLDEPTDGLDPNQKRRMRELIREMSRTKAILISTHLLEEMEATCSEATIICEGRVAARGTAEEFRAQAPGHNAIELSVAGHALEEVKRALSSVSLLERIEVLASSPSVAKTLLIPSGGENISAATADRLASAGIAPLEMIVRRGSLDDYFRDVTGEGGSS